MNIPSYGKIWSFGNPLTSYLVGSDVVVEEKIDGSQLSCMVKGGALYVRSKGAEIHLGAVPDLFGPSVRQLQDIFAAGELREGYVYRFEAMKGPKHNVITYGRAPVGNVVLLDVDTTGQQTYMTPDQKRGEADHLGVECVRTMFAGKLERSSQLDQFLNTESQLGGVHAEGIVIKPVVAEYYTDGKRICGKLVTEAFKETHTKTWVPDRPDRMDIIDKIVEAVSTPVRWEKAVQRLAEAGTLANEAKDIGPLIGIVARDVEEECEDEIKAMLWASFRKEVIRKSTSGIPQWYKTRLAKSVFSED